MMTRLTRTILSNDPELKVALHLHRPFPQADVESEAMGESDADGTGMEIVVLFERI
jgi:hypothetical protein